MDIIIAADNAKLQRQAIEGPTRKEAIKMAKYRLMLLDQARAYMKAGDHAKAFERDLEALDVEYDLRKYGFGDLNLISASPTERSY